MKSNKDDGKHTFNTFYRRVPRLCEIEDLEQLSPFVSWAGIPINISMHVHIRFMISV